MHLEHWNEAPVDFDWFVKPCVAVSEWGRVASGRALTGIGAATCAGRLVSLTTAAFNTSASGGFIPHARHGANGVRSLAKCGSKFDGTGFENEQIGHIHVAFLFGAGSEEGTWKGVSDLDDSDAVALREG